MPRRKNNPEAIMRVSEHLREVRRRLIWSLVGILLAATVGWFLVDPVLAWMQQPLREVAGSQPQLNFQTIGAAFDLRLRVAIWLGVLISSPWWIFQIGAFIAPGLRRKEKLYVLGFGLVGLVLFGAGAVSGIWVVPRAVDILNSFTPSGAVMLLRADSYITFFMRLVLAFGFSCLAPEVLVALNFAGILSARRMLRGWRWAVVAAFTFAAVANPLPSAWPMIAQGLILLSLYFLAVGIAALSDRYRRYGSWRKPRTPRKGSQ